MVATRFVRWGLVAGACLSAGSLAFAKLASPFGLTVETASVAKDHVDARVALTVPEKHVLYAEAFQVTAADEGTTLTVLQQPETTLKPDVAEPGKEIAVYAHSFDLLVRLSPVRDGVGVRVAFQGCDDKVCFMPEEHVFRFKAADGKFAVGGQEGENAQPPSAQVSEGKRPAPQRSSFGGQALNEQSSWSQGLAMTVGGGYMGVDEFLAFLDQAEGKAAPAAGGNGLAGFLRDPVAFFHAHGLVLTLVLVLVGGALLNLTPCVLPMIPVNLAIIGAGAGTRGRGFGLGAAYGVGIVLVYGGLGWVILRSGLFFGALQASPWFSLAVALVFTALTLALFDVFVIDFTRFSKATGNGRQGLLAAFSAGALSALLAGACVAPVVLAVLLLAGALYAGGQPSAQFLPFVLGLGMALPWPFAGAGLSVLPNPGMWMVRVKQAFGVLLALLAAYYVYLAAVGFRPGAQVAREGSILAGDRAAWEDKLAQAKREGKPIFVDFWATWCKNCSAMERATFKDDRVKARLAHYVVVNVQAEKPERNPAKEMLNAFDVRGLPGFVVLR